MSWNTLTTQIYNLINNNKTALGIQEVYSYPRIKFDGYPGASIFPSDNANAYETTIENERIYVWKLRLVDETKEQGIEQALSNLYTVADNVAFKIGQENELDTGQTIGQNLPANHMFINIFASPSLWGQIEDENFVFNELTIRIRVSVDVS